MVECGPRLQRVRPEVVLGGMGEVIHGGGASNQVIVSCTISGNRAGYGGWGGILQYPNVGSPGLGGGLASITLVGGALLNNIIAGNTNGSSPDVYGSFRSLGHNLVGITNGSSDFIAASDLTGSSESPLDPKLALLSHNGGQTVTLPLMFAC